MKTLTLIPAYGRAYPTEEAVLFDWIDNQKDFKIYGGQYLSIRDSTYLMKQGYTHVEIYYSPELKHKVLVKLV